jgi:hypothetical protein
MTMAGYKDICGQRFGRLVAVESADASRFQWLCRCDCGATNVVRGSNLLSGNTRSCGCLRVGVTKHGYANTSTYKIWVMMRQRCGNPRDSGYPLYGARGITVCARWHSFDAFLADMGPRPSPKHSIDRIDNDGPYSLDNCRWATPTEQARNSRRNRFIEHAGHTLCLSAWAEKTGLDSAKIWARIYRLGWTVERALTTP